MNIGNINYSQGITGYYTPPKLWQTKTSMPIFACAATTTTSGSKVGKTSNSKKSSETVPAKGTTDPKILAKAPSPQVIIKGKKKTAVFVVDITNNILYKYDKNGKPEKAYAIASGATKTPTTVGVRTITHIESYPYDSAPASTKRRKNPRAYGPKIICMEMTDTKTGETWPNGEFIHGTNNPSSIGKHVSHGCIRMDNEIIKELSSQVQAGDIVIVKK